MKTQALSGLSVFLLAGFVFSQTENAQRPEWKGKIEVESGIKVVKNPRTPRYGTLKLDLQEDIGLGREGCFS